jgi:ABC-type lipoprotein export system ATPase subunit
MIKVVAVVFVVLALVVGIVPQFTNCQAASPQLFLASLAGASCCSASNMFVVAYDPSSDFTVSPWLRSSGGGTGLRQGEVVGGSLVVAPPGEGIKLYGSMLAVKTNLEPTGTSLDQSVFLTFVTAKEVARLSVTQAERPLVVPPDSISAVMVKLAPGAIRAQVAASIMRQVPEVTAIEGNETVGFVFQFPSLLPTLTTFENVVLPGTFGAVSAKDPVLRGRARELLTLVGLDDKLTAYPRELSAGQQQRVVLARSMVNQPRLLLADEPSSNLDERTEAEIMQRFKELHESTGVTILMVTHTSQLRAYGTRAIEMAAGRVVGDA